MFNQQQLRRSTKGGIYSDFHQNAQSDHQNKKTKTDRKNLSYLEKSRKATKNEKTSILGKN